MSLNANDLRGNKFEHRNDPDVVLENETHLGAGDELRLAPKQSARRPLRWYNHLLRFGCAPSTRACRNDGCATANGKPQND